MSDKLGDWRTHNFIEELYSWKRENQIFFTWSTCVRSWARSWLRSWVRSWVRSWPRSWVRSWVRYVDCARIPRRSILPDPSVGGAGSRARGRTHLRPHTRTYWKHNMWCEFLTASSKNHKTRGQRLFQGSWDYDCDMILLVCFIVSLCDPLKYMYWTEA